MIVYSRSTRRISDQSHKRGEGKITNPNNICYVEATHDELDIILETAPFLRDSCFGRTIQIFIQAEAQAAILAFNYTEK